jgi:hypothetical protein
MGTVINVFQGLIVFIEALCSVNSWLGQISEADR